MFLELPLYNLFLVGELAIQILVTAASVLCLNFPNKLIFFMSRRVNSCSDCRGMGIKDYIA